MIAETVAVAVAVAAALLLLAVSDAAAASPWDLRCASMPVEQPLPPPVRAAALRFFPWIRPAARGLHSGPVYVVALSSRTAISRDGGSRDGAGYYLHRALVAVAPSYSGAVTVRGRRLGTPGARTTLGFSTDGATRCTVDPPTVSCGERPLRFAPALRIPARLGWRIVPTALRIGRTGCFRITAAGPGLRATIPLAVPGPDFGTPGW